MPRRRLIVLALVAVAAAAAVAGALVARDSGTDDAPPVKANAAAEALAYVPADAPLVALLDTDPSAGLGELDRRVPAARLGLGQIGVDPTLLAALGRTRVAIAAVSLRALQLSAVASDEGALHDAVDAQVDDGALVKAGDKGGADLYEPASSGQAVAVRGPVLLVAPDVPALERALDLRDSNASTYTPALLAARTAGLPPRALVRIAGNAEAIAAGLRQPLRDLPLAGALRRLAATVHVTAAGVRVRARVTIDRGAVDDVDLPLEPGSPGRPLTAPRSGGPSLSAYLKDPAHLARFAVRALQTLRPDQSADLQRAAGLLRTFGRLDLDGDVIGRLTGPGALSSRDLRTFTLRTRVRDRDELASDLGRLQELSKVAPGNPYDIHDEPGDVYTVSRAGVFLARFGIAGDTFFLTTEPGGPKSAAPPPSGRPPSGDLAGRVTAEALRALVIRTLNLPDIAGIGLDPIGDLTFGVSVDGEELNADVRLALAPG